MTDESSDCDVVQSRAISALFYSLPIRPSAYKRIEESKDEPGISTKADKQKETRLERQNTKVFRAARIRCKDESIRKTRDDKVSYVLILSRRDDKESEIHT